MCSPRFVSLTALCLLAVLVAPSSALATAPRAVPVQAGTAQVPVVQEQAVSVELELLAEGLTAPLFLASPPDDSGRLFVADQVGLVYVIDATGELHEDPFLDLRDQMVELLADFDERGLLGFAFHPDFATNGLFYISYSAPRRAEAPPNWNYTRRISEFRTALDDPNVADPSSERMLLEVDWPSRKHNGGGLTFGPDGYLYIALGDGGGAHGVGKEVLHNAYEVPEHLLFWDGFAQDNTSLYGSILRIDVDNGYPGYAIPQSNPFVGQPGRDEIYAWGFRNPYRITFDRRGTPDLFVTAVAETLWESVYLANQPGNYGWAIKEATHCFDRQQPYTPPAECPAFDPHGYPIIDPIIEYANMSIESEASQVKGTGLGTAVTGGYLYRGDAIPELYGTYVFGDWSRTFMPPSGQIFMATPPQVWGDLWSLQQILEIDTRVLSLGEDAAGELYVLTNEELGPFGETGNVYKLVPGSGAAGK